MPKVSRIRSLHKFVISPISKNFGDEVNFLPVDKLESFLKVDGIKVMSKLQVLSCHFFHFLFFIFLFIESF